MSPLKALSADIHKNLAEPRAAIRRIAADLGLEAPRITAAVRTGDTPASERAAMMRTPPHILVTTPESLYLLLTAERSRERLQTVRTVIVDEIHAVIGTRRGAHLALSLERLAHVARQPVQRIGLSATQRPVDEVARYLVGTATSTDRRGTLRHRRRRPPAALDLALEIPGSPLEAVMSHEVWEEYYDRLAALIGGASDDAGVRQHAADGRARRAAPERPARRGRRRRRTTAASRRNAGSTPKSGLKHGRLKALVATASLELGIDIGHVDLVCQIGSPHRIATFLQRVGRAGHTIHGTPKGRLFPMTRDDLVECAALLRAVRRGELDRDRRRSTRRSTCSRSRSWPRRLPRGLPRGRSVRARAPRLALPALTRESFDGVVAHAGGRLHDAARPARRADPSRRGPGPRDGPARGAAHRA